MTDGFLLRCRDLVDKYIYILFVYIHRLQINIDYRPLQILMRFLTYDMPSSLKMMDMMNVFFRKTCVELWQIEPILFPMHFSLLNPPSDKSKFNSKRHVLV